MAKVVHDIPKIQQPLDSRLCGPVALAMITQFYGQKITPVDIAEMVCQPGYIAENGMSLENLVKAARLCNFQVDSREGFTLNEVKWYINRGVPLVAVVNSYKFPGDAHYIVIKGFETNPNKIYLNDPSNLERDVELYASFNRRWEGIGRKKYRTMRYAAAIINV